MMEAKMIMEYLGTGVGAIGASLLAIKGIRQIV